MQGFNLPVWEESQIPNNGGRGEQTDTGSQVSGVRTGKGRIQGRMEGDGGGRREPAPRTYLSSKQD